MGKLAEKGFFLAIMAEGCSGFVKNFVILHDYVRF